MARFTRAIMPAAKTYPGVYIEELPNGVRTIEGVATAITAFIGKTPCGPSNIPWTVSSYSEFENDFGRLGGANTLAYAVGDFFANGGSQALIVRVFRDDGSPEGLPPDEASYQAAFDALGKTDMFNLLCLPPDNATGEVDAAVLQGALKLCVDRRAFLIVDPRSDWSAPADILDSNKGLAALGLSGDAARNAAVFFPRTKKADPARSGRIATFVPCGAVAGVMARTDAQRGVWKAPAGLEAEVKNIQGLSVSLTDRENDELNSLGVNCLRSFPGSGPVVWGWRTLRGNDQSGDEYKYIPIRRLALFVEETLCRGTQWVVFEPNDEPLWAQIRLNVGAFMHNLFRQGAFQGLKPKDAYFVKCDAETTTQNDRNLGIVNIEVGFAPLKPAEFVVIKLQQMAGQIQA
jgi:phage tail sheath protein FI